MEFPKGVGCRNSRKREQQERAQLAQWSSGFSVQILLLFMQIVQTPKDAGTGTSLWPHQAPCHCLLPPSSLFMKVAANTLRRTSAHLSCDCMLPQPSARGQPALLPALSLPEGRWLLQSAASGPRAHSPPGAPCTGSACSGPRKAQTLLVLPPHRACQPLCYRKPT